MSRTSKKKQAAGNTKAPSKVYSVGIYARLSVDADERKNESIETQTEIAKAFMKEQDDMVLYGCYTDIGKTGTDFKREGFERMMRDVRMKKIDCIIVKDLSRFGRNHIETGNYIEKIFPFMGVRFIAVTDRFDSLYPAGENETLSVSLKNLVNEMYAKDIAVKVKTSKKAKWEQGSYTGGVPPYGYRAEWVGNKKCLFPEEATAGIVRKMYELFVSGKNVTEIVKWLYENRVVRPAIYRQSGKVCAEEGETLTEWAKATVKMILTNPVYIGCLVQGRTCGKDYRLRKGNTVEVEDWSVKEHTHEPLVSEDMFSDVAAGFEKTAKYCNRKGFSKTVPLDEDIFAGMLFCGDCGAKMHRTSAIKEFSSNTRVRTYSYNCPKAKRIDAEKCVTKSITKKALEGLVKEAIRQEFSLSAMRPKALAEEHSREAEKQKEAWNGELVLLEKRMEGIRQLGSEEYLKYRMGELDADSFRYKKEENDKKILSLKKQKEELAEKLRTIDCEAVQKNHFLKGLVKGSEKTELTAEAVQTLIERIEVYTDHRVRVVFRFKRSEVQLKTEGRRIG